MDGGLRNAFGAFILLPCATLPARSAADPVAQTMQPGAAVGDLGRRRVARGADLRDTRVKYLPDLLRGISAAPPLRSHDQYPGGRDTGQPRQTQFLAPAHVSRLRTMAGTSVDFEQALATTRTGDLWLFRGHKSADRAIRITTNSPVNHVGMSVVIDDLPALMWHAEMGRSLPDLWSGTRRRGAQLHDLRDCVVLWTGRYAQRAWLRQLDRPVTGEMQDAVLRTIARLDGTPFPSTARLASGWLRERIAPGGHATPQTELDSAYCAQIVALTYQAMGLISQDRRSGWYDPGRFWSGDALTLSEGYRLGAEIAVQVAQPPA